MKLIVLSVGFVLVLAASAGAGRASAQTAGFAALQTPTGYVVGGASVTGTSGFGLTISVTMSHATPNATYLFCVTQPVPGLIQYPCATTPSIGANGCTFRAQLTACMGPTGAQNALATDKDGNGSGTVSTIVTSPTFVIVAVNLADLTDTAQGVISTGDNPSFGGIGGINGIGMR